ncbi:MAG TPA: hypothetical protein VIY86_00235, partial [Pirellulaceae bacterium]
VGTWEPGPVLGGVVFGFSPDGAMIAVASQSGSVRLMDPTSAREFVRLEHPKGYGTPHYIFTPDGTSLMSVSTAQISGFVWDLRRIREELAARGLDWELPPFPQPALQATQEPLRVDLIAAEPDLRTPEEIARANIIRLRNAHVANPDDAGASNQLAWALATAPGSLRQVDEAVELAEHAVRLKPDDANLQNTLGVAYYRAGHYRKAADCLAANLSHQETADLGYDLYVLAMSYYQIGEADRARHYLLWANGWMDALTKDSESQDGISVELTAFRREAEELIGRKENDSEDRQDHEDEKETVD